MLTKKDFDKVRKNIRTCDHLEICLKACIKEGEILEFGVFSGGTLNYIASVKTNKTIYGFDSFEGLPEDWIRDENSETDKSVYKKGHFETPMPKVLNNVELIKGFFDKTLPKWLSQNNIKQISLLHIDSDLYSSCKTILDELNKYIVQGTIIVFDELCDWSNSGKYPNWENGEFKAMNEWIVKYNRKVLPFSGNNSFRGSIKVIK